MIDKLSDALLEAHKIDVIKYDSKDYTTIGPCHSLSELNRRFEATTKEQLADAMRAEIRSRIK